MRLNESSKNTQNTVWEINKGILPVLCYPVQQWLQPPNRALAVSIEESDDLAASLSRSYQSGSDESRPFSSS